MLNHPRAMTAAAEVLNFKKLQTGAARKTQAWQRAAWGYYDQVGELKFAFNLISQVVSRVMLYAAISEDTGDVPMDVSDFLKTLEPEHPTKVGKACELADEAIRHLSSTSEQSEILRLASLNMSITGECYLYLDKAKGKWNIASIDEFIPGNPPKLQTTRSNATNPNATNGTKTLSSDTYAARIWRKHPRWSDEADSSMLGVLDQVEKVVLFDQVMRSISRSRLNAGIVWIPNGITVIDGESNTKPVDQAISDFTKMPVEDESSAAQVTPLILTGPKEQGEPKRVDLARQIDEQLIRASETALDRTLAGLDIPKDVVSGLSDVKYANSVVIDDSLYKAHIEPLVILICDALTDAYLQPLLKANGVDEDLARRFVIWYNPAQIVTRPDKSQSANEGYDRYLLSGPTWRRARGYSDLDAPDEDEIRFRKALEAQIPPELAVVLVESLAPDFFRKVRDQNRTTAGVPQDVQQILQGEQSPTSPDEEMRVGNESPTTTRHESGGSVNPNGSQPPPTPGPGPGRPGPVEY